MYFAWNCNQPKPCLSIFIMIVNSAVSLRNAAFTSSTIIVLDFTQQIQCNILNWSDSKVEWVWRMAVEWCWSGANRMSAIIYSLDQHKSQSIWHSKEMRLLLCLNCGIAWEKQLILCAKCQVKQNMWLETDTLCKFHALMKLAMINKNTTQFRKIF